VDVLTPEVEAELAEMMAEQRQRRKAARAASAFQPINSKDFHWDFEASKGSGTLDPLGAAGGDKPVEKDDDEDEFEVDEMRAAALLKTKAAKYVDEYVNSINICPIFPVRWRVSYKRITAHCTQKNINM
jgi:hypothetical protein